jgi:hypothetical protein
MKNKLKLIVTLFVLVGLGACKDDDCLTCPNNEAVVNGECECIGILFNGVCTNQDELLSPANFKGSINIPREDIQGYISPYDESKILSQTEKEFDFWNSDIRLYLVDPTFYAANNRYESYCSINTIREDGKQYFTSLLSPTGLPRKDTLQYYWPSAYDYSGFVTTDDYQGLAGQWAKHYTTDIDGETCFLRPYVKILDKDILRVTFRYVTSDNNVKAECVRLFTR